MDSALRYVSISYKLATISHREVYHFSEVEKQQFATKATITFPDITGLLILNTCNRAEVYFESKTTTASQLLDFFISQKVSRNFETQKQFFEFSDDTKETINHLLKVASGLSSAVLGDMEIVHQIKKAYQFSIANQMQGSLLERSMQTVFKSHKRISNETNFRDGTTSVAYKALKVIHETFATREKRILFIGAGDIVKQLLKYNEKFNFNKVYISNRTAEKATNLAKKYNCKVYDWKKTLGNDFRDFNVIISAVSSCHNLINDLNIKDKVLLIDLAVPSNINKNLSDNNNVLFYDLDSISSELKTNRERRRSAIAAVNRILFEEKLAFNEWIEKSSLRNYLARHKKRVEQKIKIRIAEGFESEIQWDKIIVNRVMKRLIKQNQDLGETKEIDAIIDQELLLSGIMEESTLLILEQ